MSVILFSRTDKYQKLADAYESIKHLFGVEWAGTDEQFYKALRRLYFANVATYLCQYHDDSPLSKEELAGIDPFQELAGKRTPMTKPLECAYIFLIEWSSLKYNFITNDGEEYIAKQSYEFLDSLASYMCRVVLERFVPAA